MVHIDWLKKNWLKKIGLVALGVSINLGMLVGGAGVARAQGSQLDADAHKALDNKRFENVTVAVQGDTVTLTGTVAVYSDKEDADKRIHHVKGVKGVDNEIQVAGTASSDSDRALRDKLAQRLAIDRVGYGTTPFNSITIGVQNGVVTLGGTVYGPNDKDSALSLVSNTAGVKDVIDNLEVAPLSQMDDQLRVALARAIYSAPQLQKYALDPAKPIRITVVNGHVTLTGVVDSKMDSQIAYMRANAVPGAFSVVNNLQIEGAGSGK